jgi:integrase
MQSYVAKRLADRYKKRPTSPNTIKKELTTFRLIWNWAAAHAILEGRAPIRGLRLPHRDEKPPFMTCREIAQVIARRGPSAIEEKELWHALDPTSNETQNRLDYVQQNAPHKFIYPMFVFAAHTGIRRCELVRARIDDFDFEHDVVLIREKRKSRSRATTYRRVDLTERLRMVM